MKGRVWMNSFSIPGTWLSYSQRCSCFVEHTKFHSHSNCDSHLPNNGSGFIINLINPPFSNGFFKLTISQFGSLGFYIFILLLIDCVFFTFSSRHDFTIDRLRTSNLVRMSLLVHMDFTCYVLCSELRV